VAVSEAFTQRFASELDALKERGVSHAKFAKRVGLSPNMISAYRTGKSFPSFENAAKLANALGVDVTDLTDKPSPTDAAEGAASVPDSADAAQQVALRLAEVSIIDALQELSAARDAVDAISDATPDLIGVLEEAQRIARTLRAD
jgi:transcriptional regulator with XRE-family HTH domain